MERYEEYSVLITDDEKEKRGTGTLFYLEGSDAFYILTCAHVIYTAEKVSIHMLIWNTEGDPKEEVVIATKEQFHFSPIDQVTRIGDQSTHTCDIAIIKCNLGKLILQPTQYFVYPMTSREQVLAFGYPQGTGPLYYQQDRLSAMVEKVLKEENYFLIRVDAQNLNNADRQAELKGYSGAPVWDEELLNMDAYLFGGLISAGMGANISRGRINVMNARYIQSLMYQEFGILMKNRIPDILEGEIAPGYEKTIETPDQVIIRDSWVENERRKGQTYVDGLQLQMAVNVIHETIKNAEFQKCTDKQKYEIYAVLLEAYRLAREFEVYDQIVEEMHQAGIYNERENIIEAVRYYEALDNDKAEAFAKKAFEQNPKGNEERVLLTVISVSKNQSEDISLLSEFIGSNEQLLIKPKSEREEEFLYQILGFTFGNRFKKTEKAIRCLNKAFQIGGNFIVLESLAVFYYLHAIRNAYIDDGRDRIDPLAIDQDSIDKSRDAFLRILAVADEMWLKGTIRRVGPLMFKCFYFMHDNFRIYKHYHDMVKYFEFPDKEMLRDLQICYLEVATLKEQVDLSKYEGLTEHDRKFFELVKLINPVLMELNYRPSDLNTVEEGELLNLIEEGEKQLQILVDTQIDDRLGFDKIHQDFINLYGNGIQRYHWNAISEIKRHAAAIVHPLEVEALTLYIHELEENNFKISEQEYIRYFENKLDVISFNELCHFYTRSGKIEKTKELYDSVLNERSFLIKNQSEYFYREYISFYLNQGYDLVTPLKCYVEHSEEIKDGYLRILFEMDLQMASTTFNNPDYMLDNAKTLLDEELINIQDYNQRCLIINMLNCRLPEAEAFADPMHEKNPLMASKYESMLFIWKGYRVIPNRHWKSMQRWSQKQIDQIYMNEFWQRPVKEILDGYGAGNRKAIVVDLWAIYYLQKIQVPEVLNCFEKVYITHGTISKALREISEVNDDDIRRTLINIQRAKNVIIQSPSLEDQLEIRGLGIQYMEIHQVLLLAKILDCPAFVGEFQDQILDCFKDRIIRPNHWIEVYQYYGGVIQ